MNALWSRLNQRRIHPAVILGALFVISLIAFGYHMYGFFDLLASTLSTRSSGDSSYHVQAFSNFLDGHPFQQTVQFVYDFGMVHDPQAYTNQTAVHINWVPFLFLPFFMLKPDIVGLQLIINAVNFLGILGFGYLILRHFRPKDFWQKYLVFCSLILASSIMYTVQFETHFVLFSTPWILFFYYTLLLGKRGWVAAAALLVCMVSEDSALFLIGFSVYCLLFERERRKLAVVSLAIAFMYFAFAVVILQPATRWEVISPGASYANEVIGGIKFQALDWIKKLYIETLIFRKFIPAVLIPLLIFGGVKRIPWLKVAGLCVIAPMTQWPVFMILDGGHRVMPVLACVTLALLLVLAKVGDSEQEADGEGRVGLARLAVFAGVFLLFALTNHRVLLATNRPVDRTPYNQSLIDDHWRIIRRAREIPKDKSLTHHTRLTYAAFMTPRPHVWRFPKYMDLSDYVLIQKKVQVFFPVTYYRFDPKKRSLAEQARSIESNPESLEKVVIHNIPDLLLELVATQKSYRILEDNESYLLLERIEDFEFPMLASSLGFGYLPYLPQVIARLFGGSQKP